MAPTEVQVKFLVPDAADLSTTGGLVTEMCPQCFALAPTDMIQEHIDFAHPPEQPRPERPEPPDTPSQQPA